MGKGHTATLAAGSPSMLRLCCTNSSWLQGLWKKAESHVSFQMRECSWRHRSSGVLQTGALPKHQQLSWVLPLETENSDAASMSMRNLTPLTSEWCGRPAAAAAAQSRLASLPAQEVTALHHGFSVQQTTSGPSAECAGGWQSHAWQHGCHVSQLHLTWHSMSKQDTLHQNAKAVS